MMEKTHPTTHICYAPFGLVMIAGLSFLVLCSPYHTYYRYTFSPKEANAVKTVIVAPLNIFTGMPEELNKASDKLYGEIISYVTQNNYVIKNDPELEKKWSMKIAESPGFFNPLDGKMDENKFYTTLTEFISALCLLNRVDAFIVPEIALREAVLAGDRSYWDGVYRKLEIGNDFAASDRYNFSGKTYALSLKVEIFDMHSEQIFQSFGGIENHLRLSFNYNKKVETKQHLLMNHENNLEAIRIAFYPFIKTETYPKNPKFSE